MDSNLRRNLENIEEKLDSLNEGTNTNTSINFQRQELVNIQKQFAAAQSRLNGFHISNPDKEERIEESQEAIQGLAKRIETQITLLQGDKSEVEDKQRTIEKFRTKTTVLTQKKETALRHIRELGVLPDEAFERYQDFDSKQVFQILTEALTETAQSERKIKKILPREQESIRTIWKLYQSA